MLKDFESVLKDYSFVVRHTISLHRSFVDGILVTKEDLEQEGVIGLWQAWRKYDPSRGAKFSSYAYFWVRRYILLYIKRMTRDRKIVERVDMTELYDALPIEDDEFTNIEARKDIATMRKALSRLSKRDREILIVRFSDKKNLGHVSREMFGLCPARAYRVSNDAIKRLRSEMCRGTQRAVTER